MTTISHITDHGRFNRITLPSIPVALDSGHADTAPDGRVTMLQRGKVRKEQATVTPEQMVAILKWMLENEE